MITQEVLVTAIIFTVLFGAIGYIIVEEFKDKIKELQQDFEFQYKKLKEATQDNVIETRLVRTDIDELRNRHSNSMHTFGTDISNKLEILLKRANDVESYFRAISLETIKLNKRILGLKKNDTKRPSNTNKKPRKR